MARSAVAMLLAATCLAISACGTGSSTDGGSESTGVIRNASATSTSSESAVPPTTTTSTASSTATASTAATTTTESTKSPASKPKIKQSPIPFGTKRKTEMRLYAKRHYGINTALLKRPKVIVEHFTVTPSVQATIDVFAPDVADPELHELPGVCAHFVIGKAGDIHQLVSTRFMCRHTVGLNYTSFGIEHVGYSDNEILGNKKQMAASLKLTNWLSCKYGIKHSDVIGHSESLSSPYHRERVASLKNQTHGDMAPAAMRKYRKRLAKLGCA